MVNPPDGVLLDTHTLIWLDSGDSRLGPQSRRIIAAALDRRALIASAGVFLETAWRVAKGKITLEISVSEWRRKWLARLRESPIDGDIAVLSADLREMNKDPFDCIFMATAILRRMRLLTADEGILKIKMRGLSLADARK